MYEVKLTGPKWTSDASFRPLVADRHVGKFEIENSFHSGLTSISSQWIVGRRNAVMPVIVTVTVEERECHVSITYSKELLSEVGKMYLT